MNAPIEKLTIETAETLLGILGKWNRDEFGDKWDRLHAALIAARQAPQAAADPPEWPQEAARGLADTIKRRIDIRMNDHLCEMKSGFDDSIASFNKTWTIVRDIFAETLGAAVDRGGAKVLGATPTRTNPVIPSEMLEKLPSADWLAITTAYGSPCVLSQAQAIILRELLAALRARLVT